MPKKIKKSKDLPTKPRYTVNTLKRDSLAHTDSAKKFVTFGHTHFVENPSLSGHSTHSTQSSSDNQEKPDLPGRVSFSKNDVYEIDFSDYENEDDILANYSSAPANRPNKVARPPTTINSQKEIPEHKSQSFCCSLKCNSMSCTIDESDTASNDKNSLKDENPVHEESSAVIEEYKREIESLNRKHENEIAEKEETIDTGSFSPTQRNLTLTKIDVPRLQFTHLNENTNSPTENVGSTKKYNEKTAYNNSKSVNVINLKPLNNDGISENNTKSTSNEIINNYLKATNQNEIYAQSTSKQNNLSKTPKATKLSKKTKPSPSDKTITKLKPKIGDKIDEFQIEKVESWMSIHEKSFSNGKCDMAESGAYNNEWRETPNSKTDDEGNFSFEDHIDDVSNEESNYDEIVSVIKEIDEEKSKDLGKSEIVELVETLKVSLALQSSKYCNNFFHSITEAIEHTGISSSSSTLKLKTSARSTTPDKMA